MMRQPSKKELLFFRGTCFTLISEREDSSSCVCSVSVPRCSLKRLYLPESPDLRQAVRGVYRTHTFPPLLSLIDYMWGRLQNHKHCRSVPFWGICAALEYFHFIPLTTYSFLLECVFAYLLRDLSEFPVTQMKGESGSALLMPKVEWHLNTKPSCDCSTSHNHRRPSALA